MADTYRTVTCKVRQVRRNSIMVEVKNKPGWHPIGRAAMHGADEWRINPAWEDTEQTFRIREWLAEDLGMA